MKLKLICAIAPAALEVLLDGEDVSGQIRTPAVSQMASKVSALKKVRDRMLVLQRAMGRRGSVVAEGRDIGTVIFPQAEVKIFLDASPGRAGAAALPRTYGGGPPGGFAGDFARNRGARQTGQRARYRAAVQGGGRAAGRFVVRSTPSRWRRWCSIKLRIKQEKIK